MKHEMHGYADHVEETYRSNTGSGRRLLPVLPERLAPGLMTAAEVQNRMLAINTTLAERAIAAEMIPHLDYLRRSPNHRLDELVQRRYGKPAIIERSRFRVDLPRDHGGSDEPVPTPKY